MTPTKSNHTPEPWSLGFTDSTGTVYEIEAGDQYVCGMPVPCDEAGPAELHNANASRIVSCVNACEGINPEAVPEMLEALRSLIGLLSDCGMDEEDKELSPEGRQTIRSAKAIITKATGAQS